MQDQLYLLNQISDELNKDLDLDNILQRVIDLTVSHFKASKGSIMIFDDHNRVSKYILQQQNISDDQAHKIVGQVLTEGFAGWVVKNKRGDVIHDTIEDERWFTLPGQPYTVRSVIASPLMRRQRILGVVTINHNHTPDHFKAEDLPLLNAIAGQAAIAVENARLFRQTELERAKLSAIINSSQDVIMVTHGKDHQITLLNPAAEDALGIEADTWEEKPIRHLSQVKGLEALLDDGAGTEELRLSDGRYLLANLTDVPNIGRLALMRDISALKELDKMKAEFVTTFTHDLAAPLAAIRGYLGLIENDAPISTQQQQDIEAIRMSVDQMRTLIKDLLELTRIENLKNLVKREIILQDTLDRAYKAFRPVAEAKKIKLTLQSCNASLITEGNPALVARAIENLVENAIKYTNANGVVNVTLSKQAQKAHIAIQDTGVGIPAQGLERVFDKFYRAHAPEEEKVPGSGLGLSIVKTIAERHGGGVSVSSEINVGSTFALTLPVVNNGVEPADR